MTGGKNRWLRIDCRAPAELFEAVANFVLELGAPGICEEGPEPPEAGDLQEPGAERVFEAHLPMDVRLEARLDALRAYVASLADLHPRLPPVTFTTAVMEDADWAEAWKKYFKPLKVTKNIVIKPTWERYTPVGHDVVIEVDPGMAFGTGQHPSTRMCLEALEDLLLKERSVPTWRVLDVGTGTGILGIAAAKLGAQRVLCVDIDRQAAQIAAENVRINGVEDRVQVLNRDVAAVEERFNLIAANLTAKVLIKLRPRLVDLLDGGGFLVVSGLLDVNEEDMETHFLKEPLAVKRVLREKEWLCYVLRREGTAA
ncbi:MAG TPA: 50S ribosomal protein L11 methyltransferase [Syntrophales bacterium]|nr:50S ribosomal protein L11 methyltransferase [Syntrophales bacterium]HRS86532.1 50S ribosomal protein L11 methyltransferase [Syntrophales bacterium]HRV42184.1 50S ribosomal protein L11 methyltransferase [Syntrophales bacterium]